MMKRVLLSALASLFFLGSMPLAQAKETLEYQLASLNAKTFVVADDISVARFRSLLAQLDAACVENRQQIADVSVKAQQVMKNDGISESLLNIMEGLNQVLIGKIENQRYADYAAAYVTLRNSGQSHAQAIGGLKALMQRIATR